MAVVKKIFSAISADLKVFLQKDPSVSSKWEVILFSTSFKGLALYRIHHELYNRNHKFLSMFLYHMANLKLFLNARLYQQDIFML